MQDRLVTAAAVAMPGSYAAAACDDAISRHAVVLRLATDAREQILDAVLCTAVALGECEWSM
jgi:hypothetical protein